jgi:inner membrane protein
LGGVAAQLGFRQKIGRDAMWAAFIAAMLPDLDVLIAPALELTGLQTGPLLGLRIHRGVTHSLLMIPLYCLLLAGGWHWLRLRWLRRTRGGRDMPGADNGDSAPAGTSFWWLYACVLVAVMTHPLLDTCTAYGTQLLAPFSNARFATNNVAIVDVIYTPLLVVTLLACWLVRKFARSRVVKATLVIGWVGFALSTGYLALGRHYHNEAVERGIAVASDEGLIESRDELVTADAYPALGTIFLWRTVLQTPDEWMVFRLHHLADPREPVKFAVSEKTRNQWVERARQLEGVQTFQWFTMNRSRAIYEQSNGHHIVRFVDMRYGWRPESVEGLWAYTVVFDSQGRLAAQSFEHREEGDDDARTRIGEAWHDIWNP